MIKVNISSSLDISVLSAILTQSRNYPLDFYIKCKTLTKMTGGSAHCYKLNFY